MATSATGGCMCGAVRHECTAEPVLMGNCHCRERAGGGAYTAVLGVPQSAVKITGEVKYYESIPDSGKPTRRGFCPTCGSRLFGRPSVLPDLIMIMAGNLDDPSVYRPRMDIYTASAQPWDHMNPAVPKFPKMPPMG
jgi:hypothetical protein